MGERLKIVPTKSNLLKLEQSLSFAREGYELLEQKRQVLVAYLMPLVSEAIKLQEEMELAFQEAFSALQNAVIANGKNSVKSIANAIQMEANVQIHNLRVMGVTVPKVEIKITDWGPYYSAVTSSFWLDETIARFKQILVMLERYAEIRVTVLRLAREVRKTQRRVNALEKILIPNYIETIKFIADLLEESERGMLTTLKYLKEKLEKKRSSGDAV